MNINFSRGTKDPEKMVTLFNNGKDLFSQNNITVNYVKQQINS